MLIHGHIYFLLRTTPHSLANPAGQIRHRNLRHAKEISPVTRDRDPQSIFAQRPWQRTCMITLRQLRPVTVVSRRLPKHCRHRRQDNNYRSQRRCINPAIIFIRASNASCSPSSRNNLHRGTLNIVRHRESAIGSATFADSLTTTKKMAARTAAAIPRAKSIFIQADSSDSRATSTPPLPAAGPSTTRRQLAEKSCPSRCW